jgi:hypothetical protein
MQFGFNTKRARPRPDLGLRQRHTQYGLRAQLVARLLDPAAGGAAVGFDRLIKERPE